MTEIPMAIVADVPIGLVIVTSAGIDVMTIWADARTDVMTVGTDAMTDVTTSGHGDKTNRAA